ncbi:MAG: ABC transporter permease [Bacteroidales bacterium]|nr:ABC transporter permease [Bacteroidales bacterium]
MGVTGFIAKRLQFKGRMAIIVIAISFFVIVLAESISQGFRNEINAGIATMTGDVVLSNEVQDLFQSDNPLDLDENLKDRISSIEGVQSFVPTVMNTAVLKSEAGFQGVIIKASEKLADSLGLVFPATLAAKMGLSQGDTLTSYFMSNGFKIRNFVVADSYENPLGSDLTPYVYADIHTLQRLNGWTDAQYSAVDVHLKKNYQETNIIKNKTEELAVLTGLAAQSSRQKYPQLFEWLDLIDFNVYAIILLMSIVAGFNMISGLLILLFRNISTIGTLKTLGMNNRSIASVFLKMSARLVGKAMLLGNGAALLFCLVQDWTHLIKLDPANYYVSWVPVNIDLVGVVLANLVTFAVIMLLLLLPIMFISKIDPSLSVKQR